MSTYEIVGLISGLLIIIVGVTIYGSMFLWFGVIKNVESKIAAPGTGSEFYRRALGDTIIGRHLRVSHYFAYFLMLSLPVIGKKRALLVGREMVPLTKKEKIIGFTLTYAAFGSAFCVVLLHCFYF